MMDIRDFYTHLLELVLPWTIRTVVLEERAERVDVHLECTETALLPCPHCGQNWPVCDFSPQEKTWRHLDTCGKSTYLHARLPIVSCSEHGQQHPRPPWVDNDSPVTPAFGQLIARAAKGFGDIKEAALFLRVEPAHIRHIIRRTTEAAGKAEVRAADRRQSGMETPPTPQAKQLTLFQQNDMSFMNRGIQAFRRLELEKAVELFKRHRSLYPKGFDVTSRLAAAELLLDGIREAPVDPAERPAYLCRLWNSFEELTKSEQTGQQADYAAEVKGAFFARVIEEMEQCGSAHSGDSPLLPGEIPKGYLLLQAGRYEDAIRSLQASIPTALDNAALYGYLGDAYRLRGDERVARQCYREACLIDPAGIDWRHLQDEELKELHQELLLVYGLDPALAPAWLPSHARTRGLFERKAVHLHDGLKELVNDYLTIEKALSKEETPLLSARLFFRGIILCENAQSLKFIKKIDLIQVRRQMKQANPDLFAEFLEEIIDGKGAG